MVATFQTLNTALRTLQTMQKGIQISSHNIANAATPGYSRQQAVLTTNIPYSVPTTNRFVHFGQLGTGVKSDQIQRFRSDFLDSQIRHETMTLEGWKTRQDVLQQVQVALNEPSDTGLNHQLGEFWTAWQNLATNPDSAAIRGQVAESAANLAASVQHTYGQLQDLRADIDEQVGRHVEHINDLAHSIADLNARIRDVEGVGQQPNDLRDQRDQLLTELSGMINVEIQEAENGSAIVSLGGRLLVMDHIASELRAEADPTNGMLNRVVWDDTGSPVEITGVSLAGGLSSPSAERLGGKLGGTLIARDLIVTGKMTELDDLANAIIINVNELHQTGFGLDGSSGWDFLTGTGAMDIALCDDIKADHNRIAAAATAAGVPGDGSKALEIARLSTAQLMNGGTTTFNDYYRSSIAELGQQAQQAGIVVANQTSLVQHLEGRQEEVAGVSLDEETVNMLEFQRTYQAAARVMTTVDEMLDKIINGMGVVGR